MTRERIQTSVTNIPSSSGSSGLTRLPSTPPFIRIPKGSPACRVNVISYMTEIVKSVRETSFSRIHTLNPAGCGS